MAISSLFDAAKTARPDIVSDFFQSLPSRWRHPCPRQIAPELQVSRIRTLLLVGDRLEQSLDGLTVQALAEQVFLVRVLRLLRNEIILPLHRHAMAGQV